MAPAFPSRPLLASAALCAALSFEASCPGQQPAWGPTTTVNQPAPSSVWPAQPPARIYVLPFPLDPAIEQQLKQDAAGGIPKGPIRQLMSDRPRVADLVTGFDRSAPIGMSIARQVADGLARAGLPAVFWDQPTPPPADGWQLHGEIVGLDDGNAAARSVVGFGVGNKKIGVDVALLDPRTANGRPFFVIATSDKGRMAPGGLAIGAAAGFNPYVIVGKTAASSSGISDITQQSRISGDVVAATTEALRAHGQWAPR